MKMITTLIVMASFMLVGCGAEKLVNDVKGTVALKDVEITSDTVTFEPIFPEIVEGKTFQELSTENPEKYKNPANYGVTVTYTLLAENTGSAEATFHGAEINIDLEPDNTEPITVENAGFKAPAGKVTPSNCTGTINVENQRLACRYIFNQLAAEPDTIIGTAEGNVKMELGNSSTDIPFSPGIPFKIFVTLPEEQQEFFKAVVASDIFDE